MEMNFILPSNISQDNVFILHSDAAANHFFFSITHAIFVKESGSKLFHSCPPSQYLLGLYLIFTMINQSWCDRSPWVIGWKARLGYALTTGESTRLRVRLSFPQLTVPYFELWSFFSLNLDDYYHYFFPFTQHRAKAKTWKGIVFVVKIGISKTKQHEYSSTGVHMI